MYVITEISITLTGGAVLMAALCPSSLTLGDFLAKIAQQLIAPKAGNKYIYLPGRSGEKYDRTGITSFTVTNSW